MTKDIHPFKQVVFGIDKYYNRINNGIALGLCYVARPFVGDNVNNAQQSVAMSLKTVWIAALSALLPIDLSPVSVIFLLIAAPLAYHAANQDFLDDKYKVTNKDKVGLGQYFSHYVGILACYGIQMAGFTAVSVYYGPLTEMGAILNCSVLVGGAIVGALLYHFIKDIDSTTFVEGAQKVAIKAGGAVASLFS